LNYLSVEHWFVNQYGSRFFKAKYLFALLRICFFVTDLPSHGTADHIVSLFFKMVSTVEVNPYHSSVLFFDKLLTSQKCIQALS
jgi:hypothetical protein